MAGTSERDRHPLHARRSPLRARGWSWRREPGAPAAGSGADEAAAEGPPRPAVASLRLPSVRRCPRARDGACAPRAGGAGSVAIPDMAPAAGAPVWQGGCPGRGFGAGRGDRAAWRPSQPTTSNTRSEKAPVCGGCTVTGAAWCVRSGSAGPAGSTASFQAAGPSFVRSWSDTNPAAAARRFRSGALLLSGRPQLQACGRGAAAREASLAGSGRG